LSCSKEAKCNEEVGNPRRVGSPSRGIPKLEALDAFAVNRGLQANQAKIAAGHVEKEVLRNRRNYLQPSIESLPFRWQDPGVQAEYRTCPLFG
jgi:hypothetical protein